MQGRFLEKLGELLKTKQFGITTNGGGVSAPPIAEQRLQNPTF